MDSIETFRNYTSYDDLSYKIPERTGGVLNKELLNLGEKRVKTFIVEALFPVLFRIMLLLNTPRLTAVSEEEDVTRINKKRIRNNKPPLVSYHIVDLSKDMKRRIRKSEEHELLHGKAFHYVRGHFKYLQHANKPGLYWWSPHTAGSKEFGTVHKAYVHGKPEKGTEVN